MLPKWHTVTGIFQYLILLKYCGKKGTKIDLLGENIKDPLFPWGPLSDIPQCIGVSGGQCTGLISMQIHPLCGDQNLPVSVPLCYK